VKLEELKSVLSNGIGDNRSVVLVTIDDLHNLILATETLRMVAADMVILKGTLIIERGRNLQRKSDVVMTKELTEMVAISMVSLTALKADNLASDDIGEFMSQYIQKGLRKAQ
jgi:hypothetical protein